MIKHLTMKKGIVAVILGITVTAVILMYSDVHSLWSALKNMNLTYVPLIIGLIPLNYCVKYFRYHYYLKLAKVKVPFKDEILSLLSSFVMVVTPGKIGEMLMRGYVLRQKKYDISMLSVCAMTLADRLTEGLAMAALAAVGLLLMETGIGIWAICVASAIMALIAFVLQWKTLCHKILNVVGRIKRIHQTIEMFRKAYDQSYQIFSVIPLFVSVVLGIFAWICESGVVYLSVAAFGAKITYVQAMFVVSFSGIVGAVSMVPGGIVVSDGTILGLLLWLGIEKTAAGAVTIISRFSTMWLGVVLGCYVMFVSHIRFQTKSEG